MNTHSTTKALAVIGLLAAGLTSAHAAHPLGGQDPALDTAGIEAAQEVAPAKACSSGFSRIGTTLCMTGALGPDSFANAMAVCQSLGGSVANYGAWRYRILFGDGVAAPTGWWLGPITADDTALFVNSSDTGNFDGETSRFDSRFYACSKG